MKPDHSKPELKRLELANEQLRDDVARLSVVQQQLIETRNRLDRELARFSGIHAYNAKAIGVRDVRAFAEITAEAAVDLFELEFGSFWLVDEIGMPVARASALAKIDTDALPVDKLKALLDSAGYGRLGQPGLGEAATLWQRGDHPLLAELGLIKLIAAPCCGADNQCFAWIIAGITEGRADACAGIEHTQLKSFAVFAQQAGTLLQNRADQSTIEAQMELRVFDEERLSLALEASNVGLWDWDFGTDRIYLSDAWKAQLGYHPEEIEDDFSEWQSRIHPDDVERSNSRVRDYLAGVSTEYENLHRLRHKDGHYVWIRARGRRVSDDQGQFQRMVGTHVDVSDQKSIAEKFQAIFQHSSDGYLLLDARFRVIDFNPVCRRWFGLEGDAVSASDLFAMSPPEQPDGAASQRVAQGFVETAFEDGFVRFQWWFKNVDGEDLPSEVTLVRFSLDERLLLFASIHDLSEQKRTEEALRRSEVEQRKAREQAEAANRAKSAFLATTSHEIRTPMNGVLGMLQLLEDSGLSDHQQGYVDMAQQSAKSLLAIIDDILDLSKVEAGRLELSQLPFDPAQIITDVVELFRERAETKGLELSLRFDAPLPGLLLGDAGRLSQIVTNLLGNALKFTERGSVLVRVDGQSKEADGRFLLMLVVADTGIGIDQDTRARLFTPFTQADATTTRRFGGTGLGLAICRKLAELMGGRIWVESEPGRGSDFYVRIPYPVPCQPDDKEPVAVAMQAPANAADGGRVLLVEDNAINQAVARAMLQKLGMEVVIASNGQEGLNRFMADRGIGIVFMDVQMPVMDGFEATRRLRQFEAEQSLPSTPVVALTANAMAEDRAACLSAGMDDFLSKPMTKAALRDMIERWGR